MCMCGGGGGTKVMYKCVGLKSFTKLASSPCHVLLNDSITLFTMAA